MIADLGFDFVRIPMDYWFWIEWTGADRETQTAGCSEDQGKCAPGWTALSSWGKNTGYM